MADKTLSKQRNKSNNTGHLPTIHHFFSKTMTKVGEPPVLVKSSSNVTFRDNFLTARMTHTPSSQSHVHLFNPKITSGGHRSSTATYKINLPGRMQKNSSKDIKKSSSFSLKNDAAGNHLYNIKNKSSLDLTSKTHQTVQMIEHPTSELGSDPQSVSNNTVP